MPSTTEPLNQPGQSSQPFILAEYEHRLGVGAPQWKRELLATWSEIGAPEFLTAIGHDFERDFFAPLLACAAESNPYEGYIWWLFDHPTLAPGVLHAYPEQIGSGAVLWEEWFIEGAGTDSTITHHHLLRNHPHDGEEGQWRGIDDEHPKPVLDIQWHYINDLSQIPARFR